MNPETLKPLLERDKAFLEQLYSSSKPYSKSLLSRASDSKLHTLIKLLHFISNGHIKIKREHFESIPKRIIVLLKKHFEKRNGLKSLLGSERDEKLKVLKKIAPFMQELLYPLFNEN